jgi:hypothetical protein
MWEGEGGGGRRRGREKGGRREGEGREKRGGREERRGRSELILLRTKKNSERIRRAQPSSASKYSAPRSAG